MRIAAKTAAANPATGTFQSNGIGEAAINADAAIDMSPMRTIVASVFSDVSTILFSTSTSLNSFPDGFHLHPNFELEVDAVVVGVT